MFELKGEGQNLRAQVTVDTNTVDRACYRAAGHLVDRIKGHYCTGDCTEPNPFCLGMREVLLDSLETVGERGRDADALASSYLRHMERVSCPMYGSQN